MEKGNISDYRRKLDETLASPDLTNHETIKSLVKNQILESSNFPFEGYLENVITRRSDEVSNFLDMLRSASNTSGKDARDGWKVKQDREEFRVMYREGPEGTPFHSLLVEGYVDGPLDVCLCISCESNLYKKWWPQITIPTFKIISSECLQRVRTGENISLVRMKVSWPLSSREALLHYFTFEDLQDGLVVVLLNTISDSENISKSTHGFTREGIPTAKDVVRIDVIGGFAIQKVSANRSYFRTIANMDIKLDIVPPSLINFISRQLVGSGFILYKKEVASVTNGDEIFLEALKDPLYARIRKHLYSENSSIEFKEQEDFKRSEGKTNGEFEVENVTIETKGSRNEIEESGGDGDLLLDNIQKSKEADNSNEIIENSRFEEKFPVSPEVKIALGTLDKMISIFRETNNGNKKDLSIFYTANRVKSSRGFEKDPVSMEDHLKNRKNGNVTVPIERGPSGQALSRPEEYSKTEDSDRSKNPPSSSDEGYGSTAVENSKDDEQYRATANNMNEHKEGKTRDKKARYCCFHRIFYQSEMK